jgi:EpsI family protein
MGVLGNKYARVLTLVLLVQMAAFYAIARRPEDVPLVAPLSTFPGVIDSWQGGKDIPLEKEVQDVLKADDTLNRPYVNVSRQEGAFLFIAFFKTQRSGQSPHSPKNCLPGSGWEPIPTDKPTVDVQVPGWPAPIRINHYVTEHGNDKSVTLYWYQSHNRIIASEYAAKFWLVADAIRYHRSDTALVKVVTEVHNDNVERATNTAIDFTKAIFPSLLKQLPL